MDSKSIVSKGVRYLTNKGYRFAVNRSLFGMYHDMPDDEYLKRLFRYRMGYDLDLDNPKTFNEKLQWLKLYDRRPEYTTMVDKYEVKTYVAERIGEQYIIPTLGVWNRFDEIDFDKLPDQFVLKCTHDSGGLVICRDKGKLDLKKAKKKIEQSLKRNYFYFGREWPYKNVQPRIIVEKLMKNDMGLDGKEGEDMINDYKLQCFNGQFDNVMVAEGRFSERGVRYHYFDRNWDYLPYCPYSDLVIGSLNKLKPQCFEEMIYVAEILSKGLPELRVDLYEVSGKVFFGELTFYSQSGFDYDITPEADMILGNKLILPK